MIHDRLAVIFGGGGFLGRHVAEALLKAGARVRIAERDPSNAIAIRTLGKLGQVQFVTADVTRPSTMGRAVAGADIVVNLVGVFGNAMAAVNVEGAGHVASAASAAGCSIMVHVSAIGADAGSPSAYGRSKAAGEDAVRQSFPAATILRPSVVFGEDDAFTNRFAGLIRAAPIVPVIGAATNFQPVFVGDVARAVRAVVENPGLHKGETFELGGPDVLSMRELNEWIADAIDRPRLFVDVPGPLAGAIAAFGFLPGAPITLDQYRMLASDNVVTAGSPGLADLGVKPTPLASVAMLWLTGYRKHGRFGTKPAGNGRTAA